MTIHRIPPAAALAALLVAACALAAQPPPAVSSRRPPSAPETVLPVQCAAGGGNRCFDNHMLPGHLRGAPSGFAELAGKKGYVTRSGAAHDPWLARHFTECDVNHDGKLDRFEYDTCRREFGPRGPH